jgi:hypothetical protein
MMTFDELKARYPDLIPPGFSFQCGAGWIGILTRYFDDVAALLPEGEKFVLDLVQSRHGTLTIDASYGRGVSGDVVNALDRAGMLADARSVRCCETCGSPGRPREGEWTSAACDEHARGLKEVAPEVAVFTCGETRYVYDVQQDALVILTTSLAKTIPWLEDA